MDIQNEYLKESEVSKITRQALSTLRNNRFNRKGIPYIKVGKSVVYSKEDVIAYIESRRVQTDQSK